MTDPAAFEPSTMFRQTRVVVFAMCGGIALFSGIAALVAPVSEPLPDVLFGMDVIALVALLLTITTGPIAYFLPTRLAESARGGDTVKRVQAFCSGRILGAAVLEGPALLWVIAFLCSGQWLYLAPLALLLCLVFLQAPSADAFVERTGVKLR